ncbi:hypothetical protein GCM10007967_14270 [Xylanimonas ulmi]
MPVPFDPTPLYADATPPGDFATYREARRQIVDDGEHLSIDAISPDSDLLTVIAWGVKQRTITREDGQMLATVYQPGIERRWGFDEASTRLGASRSAVKMRCSRAVARLAEAWRTETTMA